MKKFKTADFIINQLILLPQFKLLNRYRCCKKFISLLNPRYQKAISFISIKNNTLKIAISHPGINMELNSNKDFLKSILTKLINKDERCKDLKASRIVLFNSGRLVARRIDIKEKKDDTIPRYKERALGNFKIDIEDKDLKKRFIDIKKLIKKGYI